MTNKRHELEIATLGGGCFWCVEAVYLELAGVEQVRSGYAGGTVADPTYEQVCTGSTGHAEVVQVSFDPAGTTYRDILEVFFAIHDPTTLDRQGGDVGSQYRSVIFTHSPEQKATAEKLMTEISAAGRWADPLVTEITPFTAFYQAEAQHQDYYGRNGGQPYCRMVIAPKLAKFRRDYAESLRR
ncbi:MAG: peptide-methionine (S)-S-oxide reductase MsrA [Candidatus Marinimicrobia bacterium]|nr:peptide-methionine (S)-S-oxide reductase MsrA [Candidatus Neomarinimicrobiota bacterium]